MSFGGRWLASEEMADIENNNLWNDAICVILQGDRKSKEQGFFNVQQKIFLGGAQPVHRSI